MELKITADKKLLEVLDRLASAMTAAAGKVPQAAPETPQTAAVAQHDEVAAPEVKPEQPASENTAPFDLAPTREEIRALATIKIQAGHRDAVKALIGRYGGTRVSDVPEDQLAEFKAGLEAIA